MPDTDFSSPQPDDDATRLMTGGVAAPAVLRPGTVVGNTYVIEALLDRGGMGEVYRAKHIELGTEHAIKIILPSFANDPQIVHLFREEARKLGRINNAAIVDYEGFFPDEHGLRYLVTEFVHGESLEQILRRRRLEAEEVLRLRDRLALGLAAAHEMDIVHRDVSPENILLPEGNIDRAKLIDFGIAKSMEAAGTTLVGNTFAGKYSFASPEQVGLYGGKVDLRSDIYSLGLVLAAAAIGFGKKLDMGNSPATVLAARQSVPDLGDVPASLRPVIAPMLEPRPDDRPPSMRALLTYQSGGARKPAPEVRHGPGGSSRRRAMLAVTVVAALAVLAGSALLALRELRPPPSEAALRAALTAATTGYQCASLDYAVGPDRAVRISGYVDSRDDIAQLRRMVGTIQGVAKLDFAVQLRIWPYCAVLGMLHGLRAHPPRGAASLALLPTSDAAHLGDPLVVDLRTPSFDGYVYVDYFDREGQVLHLFPNSRDRLNFRPARNHLILGRPPFARCWVLGGSTGEQLVTMIASGTPLLRDPRPEVEDARSYLASLSQAVGGLAPSNAAAALRFFLLQAAVPGASPQAGCRS
ncbi:MAG: serine/threonine-protein kinase [Stellaceae bacterium]